MTRKGSQVQVLYGPLLHRRSEALSRRLHVARCLEHQFREWAQTASNVTGSEAAFRYAVSDDVFPLGDTRSERFGWSNLLGGFAGAIRNEDCQKIRADYGVLNRYALGVLGTASLMLEEIRRVHGPALAER